MMENLFSEDIPLKLKIGTLPHGARNLITDVPGVTVGHATIDTPDHKTGVTVILPGADDPFRLKYTAASHVLNGFGKTQGLVQVDELGTLETPIALTNTLNVGIVHDAMVEYMARTAEQHGYELRSVNPVVCECNDGGLNDIRHRAVTQAHVMAAIESAGEVFAEGDVGAGKGTVCHGFKGGIGSSSRVIKIGKEKYILGILVQTNHGRMEDLTIDGAHVGGELAQKLKDYECDQGSCIVILATDLPVTDRQLKRILHRIPVGMARLGAYVGNGSGEIFVGFTTRNRVPQDGNTYPVEALRESHLDKAFRAAAEATEEAVLKSMLCAGDVTGWDGKTRHSLRKFFDPAGLILPEA